MFKKPVRSVPPHLNNRSCKTMGYSVKSHNMLSNKIDAKVNGTLWSQLADRFNTFKVKRCIHPDAAVNIEVGWPVFLSLIKGLTKDFSRDKLSILDFGCGVGEFCRTLAECGHVVTGVDHSEGMLSLANSKVDRGVRLIHADHKHRIFSSQEFTEKYDAVTAIHSLEWISDDEIEEAFLNLSRVIKKNGLMIFAVFPQDHVVDSLKIKDLFEDFDSLEEPHFGYANFDGVKVPVWIRTVTMYDNVLKPLGFKRVFTAEPDYPKDFFKKYSWSGSKYPEMTILAYKKLE